MSIGDNASSQSLPFSIEVNNQGPASFSNFRMAKSANWGNPIDVLRFDVRIERMIPQCGIIFIERNVVAKSGAYISKGSDQMITNFVPGEVHTRAIGGVDIEWPQVGKVQTGVALVHKSHVNRAISIA